MSIFGELERFVADLYPYRVPITIGMALVALAGLAVAFRQGWHVVVWRHRLASAVVAVIVIAGAVPLGNYFLSPLWERSFLEEQSPLALASEGGTPASLANDDGEPTAPIENGTPAAAGDAVLTHRGEIEGADEFHFGRGTALLIETEPGRYTLRFEEFSVRNGPDLFVYLAEDKDSVNGAVNLGDLKATDGAFNYEVPAGTDVSRFRYAIVWCRQFAVLFASAPLAEVS